MYKCDNKKCKESELRRGAGGGGSIEGGGGRVA
jgi:hypothetical protein